MARGRWILVIDADEVLNIAHEKALRELLANDRLHAIELLHFVGKSTLVSAAARPANAMDTLARPSA
jgi:hypothetical protein